MLAILLMNVFAPTIDHYVIEANIKKRLSRKTNLNVALKMNRDSNFYTFTFAALMVLVVASVLAFTARSLKDRTR